MPKTFAVGDTVWAQWPGSRKYYEATVLDVGKTQVQVDFKDGYKTEVPLRNTYKELPFRSRSASPSRSPSRRRSRSPARRSRSRSRSPARSRGRPPAQKSSEESPVAKMTQQTVVTPSRRSPRRGRMPEKKVEESSSTTTTVTKDSSSVTTLRVTRSVTKKLIPEEKEALLTAEIKPTMSKSRHGYEFGGPFGVFFMMLALPAIVVASYLFCRGGEPCSIRRLPSIPPFWRFKGGFFDIGHLIVDGWIILQALIYMLPVGKVVYGRVLADGTSLDYRTNGFIALMLSVHAFAACIYFKVPVTLVYDCFIGIITATLLWSVMVAVIVYVMARKQKKGLSPGGNTGNVIYDFFMGHQLNPRWGKFDFKFFFEVRPGLIGWVMINFCMAAKEYEKTQELSTAMLLVCIFQFIYVADCLLYESSILSTMDIIEEGFGFMLAFGDISWVPVMYSLQARYLVDNPVKLPWTATTAIVVLFVIGYAIFRGSNSQKDRFRTDPNSDEFQDQETILTPTGRRLLASGWWGVVRHPNYLGDIIMAFAWTIPCGISNPIPFFYPVYLTILLVHRELRDEANNRRKYGAIWDEYCRRVPYRIFPKIF
ncbi:hypothetical protein ACROYT_G040979 [Oculina patagonica]